MSGYTWLDSLADEFEADPSVFGYAVWREAHGLLTDAGMDSIRASRIALRHPQLAVLLLHRYEQRQAAELLRVSARTAKTDAQRVRQIVCSGALREYRGQRVPRLRVPADARIVVCEPPRSRSRR